MGAAAVRAAQSPEGATFSSFFRTLALLGRATENVVLKLLYPEPNEKVEIEIARALEINFDYQMQLVRCYFDIGTSIPDN
jgi:hypothetical protein